MSIRSFWKIIRYDPISVRTVEMFPGFYRSFTSVLELMMYLALIFNQIRTRAPLDIQLKLNNPRCPLCSVTPLDGCRFFFIFTSINIDTHKIRGRCLLRHHYKLAFKHGLSIWNLDACSQTSSLTGMLKVLVENCNL